MIKQRKENLIKKNNERENRQRIQHTYKVGDKVLVYKPGIIPTLTSPKKGPYPIVKVHTNGTVTIQRGVVVERLSIRRITPYHD